LRKTALRAATIAFRRSGSSGFSQKPSYLRLEPIIQASALAKSAAFSEVMPEPIITGIRPAVRERLRSSLLAALPVALPVMMTPSMPKKSAP